MLQMGTQENVNYSFDFVLSPNLWKLTWLYYKKFSMEAIKIGFIINEGTVINSETKDMIAKETNSIELGSIIIV